MMNSIVVDPGAAGANTRRTGVPLAQGADNKWVLDVATWWRLGACGPMGTRLAEHLSLNAQLNVTASSSSANAPAVVARLTGIVGEVLAAEADYDEALRFLSHRLREIAGVHEALATRTREGLDVWVLVDEPYLDNEESVLTVIGRARHLYRNIFIDFLLLPSSSAHSLQRSGDAAALVPQR